MLFDHQQQYLDTLPDDGRVAKVVPFDPKTRIVADELIQAIQSVLSDAQIIFQGSSKLGIAGENDIDITVIFSDFTKAFEEMNRLFVEAKNVNFESKHAHWDFVQNGFPVDMGLQAVLDPKLQEQLDTLKILEESEVLRLEYEQIKLASNGLPWKEYLIKKYEFWNKLLEK